MSLSTSGFASIGVFVLSRAGKDVLGRCRRKRPKKAWDEDVGVVPAVVEGMEAV